MSKWIDDTDLSEIELKETKTGFNYLSLRNFLYSIGNPVLFTRGRHTVNPYLVEYSEECISLTGFDKSSFILRDSSVNRWMVINDKYLVVEFSGQHIPTSVIFTPYAPTTLTKGAKI